jgi:hypothetical protein
MTSLFGRTFRKEPAGEPAPEIPPRPARRPYRESGFGPDTIPRLFGPMGELDPDWDPCGRPHPPLETGSDEGGAA